MPQDRLRSPRAGHGRRTTALTDFEYRVWDQYQLSADDFGVMRCSPINLQADNDYLAEKPAADIQASLERMIEVGLVVAFEHQGRRWICQTDWQTFQKVQYPRRTFAPKPPNSVLAQCDRATSRLFLKHPGGTDAKRKRNQGGSGQEPPPEQSGNSSGINTELEQKEVGPPLTANTNANANGEQLTANRFPSRANGRSDGVLAGALPKDHLHHAFCADNLVWCVPEAVHIALAKDLSPQFDGDIQAAKAALAEWYPKVWANLPTKYVTGDAFKFWRGRFNEQFASKDPTARGPAVMSLTETDSYLDDYRARRQRG